MCTWLPIFHSLEARKMADFFSVLLCFSSEKPDVSRQNWSSGHPLEITLPRLFILRPSQSTIKMVRELQTGETPHSLQQEADILHEN